MACSLSSSSSPTSPHRSTSNRRLSLSALCNPSPASSQPAMLEVSHAAGPSSPRRRGSESSREHQAEANKLSLDADDESVMIAVRALDDMRSGVQTGTSASSSPSSVHENGSATKMVSSSATSRGKSVSPEESLPSAQFVSRVSGLPIVTTALRAYEQGKASSRVVKYGAEIMESSVRRVSKPVINRLPVTQIDEFACRQLDRFGKYGSDNRERTPSRDSGNQTQDKRLEPQNEFEEGKYTTPELPGGAQDDNESQLQGTEHVESAEQPPSTQDIVNRSRWHSILYEAGGISAAVSEESMRRLKFCLQWLQYATEHIDGQILVLRNFIASLNAQGEGGNSRPISASHMQTLTSVKRDVVKTIRQVVDVVSKYAGAGLPEPARSRVRQFILHLPQRWATSSRRQAQGPAPAHVPGQVKNVHKRHRSGLVSATNTAPSSPLQSPKIATRGIPTCEDGDAHRQSTARPTAGSATQAAQRILTLATESLDMMRNVTGIVKESLDRADVWVDRLRVIGVQRRNGGDASDEPADADSRRAASELSIEALTSAGSTSSSTTGTFTSFPPSPRSVPLDMPSPGTTTAGYFDSLTLNSLSATGSALATPRSSTQSLPALAGYDWECTTQKLQTIRDADEKHREEEDEDEDEDEADEMKADAEERSAATALSALRTGTRAASMDVDNKD